MTIAGKFFYLTNNCKNYIGCFHNKTLVNWQVICFKYIDLPFIKLNLIIFQILIRTGLVISGGNVYTKYTNKIEQQSKWV